MAKRKPPRRPRTPPLPPPPVADDTPLTPDQELFVQEYLVDRKIGMAYLRCHPNCRSVLAARAQGSVTFHLPNVRAEIRARLRESAIRNEVRADDLIKEIQRVAFSDVLELFDPVTNHLRQPRHVPFDLRRAIASVRVSRARTSRTRNGRTTTKVTDSIIEYKLWPKMDAIAKLANHLGLSTELPPIEKLLMMLPRTLAAQVRDALVAGQSAAPSPNGKH